MDIFAPDFYHKPQNCKKCGGSMVFKGVGEYQCEKCRAIEYDDYGIVRRYIENHKGATAAQIEEATGISQKTIRQMLKDEKLEVTKDSVCFLHCEICGANIRSGKLCLKCQSEQSRMSELKKKEQKKTSLHGYSKAQALEKGERRFRY